MRFILLVMLSVLPAGAQESLLREASRLDSEQKCDEAEHLYQKALSQGPISVALLNNTGNHYLVCGTPEKAEPYFHRIVKSNPQHGNANLQLARMATGRHQGAQALSYLTRVGGSQPEIRMLRAEASYWAGKQAEALAMLDALAHDLGADPRLLFLYGLTCARMDAFDRAEAAFNAVVEQHPSDFDVLVNLGRAAARARHYDRARRALEVAIKLNPESVDALAEMGQVSVAMQDYAGAVFYLAKARQLAPKRPDIALALARAAQAGAYYGDAALAYDDYLRLKPGDDDARRDRAFVCGYVESRMAEGTKELAAYLQKHPNDPLGHYELALLSWRERPQEALDALTQATRLDPEFAAARVNRAWLLNRLGRTAEAIPDLKKAIEIDAQDVRALDLLGAAYSSLDRPSEAEPVLRRALSIAPNDPDVLIHLGHAVMELGREDEAAELLSRFERIRPQRVSRPWRQPGMIESATLPAAERTKRQIDRLRKAAGAHPDDPELQLRLAGLLLTDGKIDEASAEFRTLLSRNANARIRHEAGRLLLSFGQWELAREFLEGATAEVPGANLDLAISRFFTEGPVSALAALEHIPAGDQSGDYWLLKASLLDSAGRGAEAEQILRRGLSAPISRPAIVHQAALLLLRQNRNDLALDLLNKGSGSDPELRLLRGIVLGRMDQASAAEKAFKKIESEWPEWDRPYLAHGLLLERSQPLEAGRKLRTAIALGSQDPAARCALAALGATTPSDPQCACKVRLDALLFANCVRP